MKKEPKVHYAPKTISNENTMFDEGEKSYCGLENTESKFTNKTSKVTCKKCLKSLSK